MTFVQRFNAMLQSFVHFHVVARGRRLARASIDGAAVFHKGPAPSTLHAGG